MEEIKKYYCSNCGFVVSEKDSYCRKCGHQIIIYNMKDIDDTAYICKSCRIIIPLGKRICSKCGAKINWKDYIDLKNDEHICHECGYIVKKSDNFCSRCGIKFDMNYIFLDNKDYIEEKNSPTVDDQISEKHTFIERIRRAINNLRPLKQENPNNKVETTHNAENRWKNANPESIKKAKEIIETLFAELDFCYATDSKVLGRLLTFDEDLVKELNLDINNFKDFIENNCDYYYEYPFVGTKEIISPKKMVVEFLKNKNMINHQMILDFFNSIGYTNHQSYKIYFDELVSNGFCRIDDEVVVTYDSFELDESILKEIKSNIDYYFENSTVMDTAKLSRYYFMLPKIKYSWNSYVLALIIRKFFKEEYDITNNSDGKNYLIRRK